MAAVPYAGMAESGGLCVPEQWQGAMFARLSVCVCKDRKSRGQYCWRVQGSMLRNAVFLPWSRVKCKEKCAEMFECGK